MDERNIRERALGAYLGLAVGDALGATTEFMRPAEIRAKFGLHQNMTGGGWLKLKPGAVTDDTQMSLYLGEAILESGGMNAKAVADKFIAWMRSKPPDIGGTIRRSLQMYIVSGRTVSEESEYSAGNGAAMRNIPVIISCISDAQRLKEWTLEQARVTHNNQFSDNGTLILSHLTRLAIVSGQAAPLHTEALKLLLEHPDFNYKSFRGDSDGYIVNTVKIVLHYFFNTRDFESCLLGIVNQGGDADTNGAIAGMLAGAFYGLSAIPARWLSRLDPAVKKKIEKQTEDLINLFPPTR
jgi:ADP-ribosyl-[dinitrogen reductase] hydrolase